jgi:SAM-dependent methyltransferase
VEAGIDIVNKFSSNYFRQYLSSKNGLRDLARNKLRLTPMVPRLRGIVRQLPSQAQVVDIGCGTGGFLNIVEYENESIVTHGVDVVTPPEFSSSATFVQASAENLPFSSNKFDLVTSSHVLEHLNNPYLAVAEMVRICRPGGYVYIETPSARSTVSLIGGTFWDDPTHIRPYPPVALEWIVSGMSVEILKKGYKRSLPALILGLPYAFVGSLLGDKQASSFFPAYAFGFFAYLIGQKSSVPV